MASLRPQPRFRCQDTVARKVIGAEGSPAQETLGLLWRVAGLEESDDELSLSSEEEEDSIIDSSSPPEGHAQVAWLDKACFEQVKDKLVEAGHHGLDTASVDELRVVDRHLAVGDVVAHESDPLGQTAVVTAVHRLVDLELSDGRIFLQMPISSVAPVVPFFPDQYVVKSGWLGRIEEVLELVRVRMADGTLADFHCDLNSRPVTPLHPSDYIFREERTSPYWPGQKVTVDTKMTAVQRILPGKAIKSGTVLSVAAEELVVDWLTCCGGDPACMPPDVISAGSGSVTPLKYVASQPGMWHLGGRGLWLGPTTADADGGTSTSIAQDRTGADVPADLVQSKAEATAGTAGTANSDATGTAFASGMGRAPQNAAEIAAVAGSTAAAEVGGNVLGVMSSGTEASSESTRPAGKIAPAPPIPGLEDNAHQPATPATGRPSFAQVVRSGAQPLDPQLQTKPSGSAIAGPCTEGTPRSSASTASPHRGGPGGNASSAHREASVAGGGAVGWVGSIANRILSLPASGAPPGGGQRRKRKPRNRNKKKDARGESSEVAVTALVTLTSTSVDLDWQDGRSEAGIPAVSLLPRHHLDDREFWPNDFVQLVPDNLAGEQPDARVGVIRSYDAADRTAAVAWLTQSEDGWLQPLDGASPVETLPVYALEAHAHFSCCVGDVVIRLRGLVTPAGDMDSWTLLDNLGEICGTRWGCQRVLFASGEESYVMPDKMAILTRQDSDSAEEETEEEGWSQSSWSTCSGDDAASQKGAEKYASGMQHMARPDDSGPCPARPSAGESLPDLATPAQAHDGRAATAGDVQPPLRTSGGRADAAVAASDQSGGPMAQDTSTAGARPVSPPLPIPGNSSIADAGSKLAVEPEALLLGPRGITFGSFDAEELGRICRAAKAFQPSPAEDAPAGIWGMANRFFGGTAADRTAGNRDATVVDASSAPVEPADEPFARFEVLESAAGDHLFIGKPAASTGKKFHKAVLKEWDLLKGSLPSSIWMQAYESRMDLMRAAILGAAGTPYAGHLFFFDIQLPPDYPASPPNVLYHSWGMRVNPNLYEEGRVCLSLLGTWTGHRQEMWTTASTILQLVVSIQGLILVPRPYFNEAGFERQAGSAEGEKNAVLYNEQAFLLTTRSSIHCLRRPLGGFQDLIKAHYKRQRAGLLAAYQEILDGKSPIGGSHDGPPQVGQGEPSAGFRLMLQQLLPKFKEALDSL